MRELGFPGGVGGGVQLLSCVQLFATPWTVACQASLSFTISWRLLRFMSNELIIPTNHLILCCPFSSCLQSFSGSGSFPMIWLFTSGGQSTGASASASILPMNIQGWFPLGLTGLISLLSKGLSRVVSRITVQNHQLFSTQSSLWSNSHICTSGKEPSCQCRRCKTCRFDPWVRKIP